MKCYVPTCGSREKIHPGMSFHRAPKAPDLRRKWFEFCNLPYDSLKNLRVCNIHFAPYDYENNAVKYHVSGPARRILKKNAVPTIEGTGREICYLNYELQPVLPTAELHELEMYCCIRSCSARYGKVQVSFHRFPQNNEVRRQRWIDAAGRGSEINYDYAMICSRHFVTGRPARVSDCEAINWIPTLLLDSGAPEEDWRLQRNRSGSADLAVPTKEIEDNASGVRCVVRGCGMTKAENPSLLFFPVPKDQQERSKWLLQIGMHDNHSLMSSRKVLAVCELHFELSKDLLNYDDVITMGRAALLKEHVMPTRNIPVVFGHQTVRYSHEIQENSDQQSTAPLESEQPQEDEDSLLQEMVPRQDTMQLDQTTDTMPAYPEHLQPSPVEEFVQVCRSCLCTDTTTLVSAFDDNLADIFYQFTNVTIGENEGISTLICQECKSRLLELHFFRDSCVTNTQILIHRYRKCYGMVPESEQGEEEEEEEEDENDDNDETMKNRSSDYGNGSVSNERHYRARTDDPEDLLVPQKEEKEDDSWNNSKPLRGRPRKGPVQKPVTVMKKRYSCKFCRKEYNSKPGIDVHMAVHANDDPSEFTVECNRCEVRRKPGEKHSCIVDILYCHVCGEKFRKWSYLKIHLAKSHRIKTKRRELMLMLMANKMGRFDKGTFLKTPPKKTDTVKSVREEPASSSSNSNTPTPWAKCGFCEAVFKHPSSLDVHVKSHSAVQLTQCNECNEDFQFYKQLEKHHDTHEDDSSTSGGVQKKCGICGKVFNRRQTLILHRQYVHRDKDVVQCSSCSKLFANAKTLAEHDCTTAQKTSSDGNGDFVIVRAESIMKAAFDVAPTEEASTPVAMQEDNADPLLGLGNEEVIELESDDEDESSQDRNTYDCAVCGKNFEKADVLDRHMKLHRMMNAAKANEFAHWK